MRMRKRKPHIFLLIIIIIYRLLSIRRKMTTLILCSSDLLIDAVAIRKMSLQRGERGKIWHFPTSKDMKTYSIDACVQC